MKKSFKVNAIGQVKLIEDKKVIALESKYSAGLIQIEDL